MARQTLRGRILLYTSAVVVLIVGLTLAIFNSQAQRLVNERITANLAQGKQRIEASRKERVEALRLGAQIVASFPALNALLTSTDPATIRDFMTNEYLPRLGRADLLVILDPSGRVVARTDSAEPAALPDAARWTQAALANQATTGVYVTGIAAYDVAVVPASAGGTVFGFVMSGARIDDAFARSLRGSNDEDVVVAGPRVLGTTLPSSSLPWRTAEEWGLVAQKSGQQQTVTVEGGSYLALPFTLHTEEPKLLAVILQSRDTALAPYRSIQWIILVAGVLLLAIGIGMSSLISRSIASSVLKLTAGTERVARGDFSTPIEVQRNEVLEISNLTDRFNEMQRGLREREAIGKFVSQSTIEMIQADAHKMAARGQRIELTVFFSDIRGFTELSEKRAPEEVVKILNHCLSLQANIIQKYRGDVDKFVGDCVVAHFYDASSAMDAIQCAIEIEKALEKCNAALHLSERIEVGIGITTGEVVLGSIGSEERRDFTAIGSNVNLASRLCSAAGAGEILLAESTFERVQEKVPAERLDPLSVKGFSKPIPVYRIAVSAKTATV
jgi:class 3 adenylate cyclase